MKAIRYSEYGGPEVLRYEEVKRPSPGDDDVLVKIHAASVNSWDWDMLRGIPRMYRLLSGLRKPKYTILGADIAGEIIEAGRNITKFKAGDKVMGDLCEHQWGAFAEYTCAREQDLVLKPDEITFSEAAALPQAAVMAYQAVHLLGRVEAGQKILINGAGGGTGSFAIQMAKNCNAEITAVDVAKKFELMDKLGATHLIDFKKEDFTQRNEVYDLIIDIMGHHSIYDYRRVLSPNGRYLMIGGGARTVIQTLLFAPIISSKKGKKLGFLAHKPNLELDYIAGLAQSGAVKSIIDKVFPLGRTPEAIQYLGDGNAMGKVIISVT